MHTSEFSLLVPSQSVGIRQNVGFAATLEWPHFWERYNSLAAKFRQVYPCANFFDIL